VAWGVKHIYYPPLDEKFFQVDYDRLRSAPPGVLIFRPSLYARSVRSEAIAAMPREDAEPADNREMHLLGHNVTPVQAIALAHGCLVSRVLMPRDAPTNHYDFLVTTKQPYERLQQAINHKLGYTAQWQDRTVDALELRRRIVSVPGFRLSSAADPSRWEIKNEILRFHNAPVAWLADAIERLFNQPVIDETGLSNRYDFEIRWNWRGWRTDADREALSNSLSEIGLKLERESESVRMLVEERAK
jgi:uncharacterized protein (TIGR03435 family)